MSPLKASHALGLNSSTGLASGWVEKLWGDPRSATVFAQLATGIYRRDGTSWTEITEPFSSGEEADLDGFVFDAASPLTIYALDTSEYWLSTDGGTSCSSGVSDCQPSRLNSRMIASRPVRT